MLIIVVERAKRYLGLAPAARADIEHALRNRWITRQVMLYCEILVNNLLTLNHLTVYGPSRRYC